MERKRTRQELYEIASSILERFFVTPYYAVQTDSGVYRVSRCNGKDLEVNEETIITSLKGDITVGVYSTNRSNKCKWIVVDFDFFPFSMVKDKKHYNKVVNREINKVINKAHKYLGLKYHLENSGNKGYHLWIFFEEPIDAKIAYWIGKFLSKDVFAESFPKQPDLNGLKYGNLVKLPCNINKKNGRRSFWIENGKKAGIEHFLKIEANKKIETKEYEDLILEDDVREFSLIEIPKSVGEIVDKHPIPGPGNRHRLQFFLILDLFKNGYNIEEVKRAAELWLNKNKGKYNDPYHLALGDYQRAVNYVYNRFIATTPHLEGWGF